MPGSCKYWISFLLVMILLMPALIQLGHRHDHGCKYLQHQTTHVSLSGHCLVCDFQYLIFFGHEPTLVPVNHHVDDRSGYGIPASPSASQPSYTFLLRAPPLFQVV